MIAGVLYHVELGGARRLVQETVGREEDDCRQVMRRTTVTQPNTARIERARLESTGSHAMFADERGSPAQTRLREGRERKRETRDRSGFASPHPVASTISRLQTRITLARQPDLILHSSPSPAAALKRASASTCLAQPTKDYSVSEQVQALKSARPSDGAD